MDNHEIERAFEEVHRRLDAVEHRVRFEGAEAADDATYGGRSLYAAGTSRPPVFITRQGTSSYSAPGGLARASVEASTSAGDALACTHGAYKRADNILRVVPHSTTAQAFANLRNGNADFSIIVGHGCAGGMVTGPGAFMSASNPQSWIADAELGIPGDRLVIFACDVAAGPQGADFLQKLANALRKEVGAWTQPCFSHCFNRDCWATGSGCFQVATPCGRLEPVDVPEMFEGNPGIESITVQIGRGYDKVAINEIRSVNFTPLGFLPEHAKAKTMRDAELRPVLELINFTNPMTINDQPLSIVLGQLTIDYANDKWGECSRAFRVFCCSLVQDCYFPNIYYFASSKLISHLAPGFPRA